jgi:hypothetical protein
MRGELILAGALVDSVAKFYRNSVNPRKPGLWRPRKRFLAISVEGTIIPPMPSPEFNVHYANGRTTVVMEADLDRGWKRLEKTYGFFSQTRVPYKGDLTLRTQLVVQFQPASFEGLAHEFLDLQIGANEYGDEKLNYQLANKQLIVSVALHPDMPWRKTPQGRPEIFVEQLPFLSLDAPHWYDLRAWIVVHESPRRPIPDLREWTQKHFVSGGQFESNRRKH